MRKIIAAIVCLAGLPSLAQADTTSFEIDVGVLRTATGAALPDGTLLQLIAAPDGAFTAPTAGSFTSGDETVIDNFAVDSTTVGPPTIAGETDTTLTINLSTTVTPGEKFEVRWFPGLTLSSTNPAAGQTFGEFRSDTSEGNGDSPWVLPAASSNGTFIQFTTLSSQYGGPYADSRGDANEIIAGTPLPEPSTYAMMGLAAVGLVGMKLRQRRARQS